MVDHGVAGGATEHALLEVAEKFRVFGSVGFVDVLQEGFFREEFSVAVIADRVEFFRWIFFGIWWDLLGWVQTVCVGAGLDQLAENLVGFKEFHDDLLGDQKLFQTGATDQLGELWILLDLKIEY
jgi:hypothetical protein